MNIFVYNSQDPQTVGQKIAEIVGKELNMSAPGFEVEMPDVPAKTSAKTVIGDLGRSLFFGGKTSSLFSVIFKLDRPRSFEVRANIIRSGTGCAVSYLLYSTPLGKDIDTETTLGEPKVFGAAKFTGGEAAQKLNANADFIKRANKLARSESSYGPLSFKIQRMFTLFPKGKESAMLAVGTLARPTAMGMSVSMDLKEFSDLADTIEKLL